jgi:hypothetical protein
VCGDIDVRASRRPYRLSPSRQMLAVDGMANEEG